MSDKPTPLDSALADIRYRMSNQPRENQIIAEMWAWQQEMTRQSHVFAQAKSFHGREVAKVIISERLAGEKSAAVAEKKAETVDEIYAAHVAYRLAEQLVYAAKEGLRILHAELDKLRTQKADARAADQFTARTQT